MDDQNQRYLLRLALMIEYLAATQPGIKLFSKDIRRLRNDVQHCPLDDQGLYGVLSEFGDPKENLLELCEKYPIEDQDWMQNEETALEDALLVFLYSIKELKEHIYERYENSMDEHFEAIGQPPEERIVQLISKEFDISSKKTMMRKFKRWRCAYLGDTVNIHPSVVWRVRHVVDQTLKRRPLKEWQLVDFTVGDYDYDLEKRLKTPCKKFDRFCYGFGTKKKKNDDAKKRMIDFMEKNVGVMTVPGEGNR